MINFDYAAPRYGSGTTRARLWDVLKIVTYYLFLFVLTVYVIRLYSYLGKIMIKELCIAGGASLFAYWRIPGGDREQAVNDIRRNLFIYDVVALLGYVAVTQLQGIDSNMLGVSFGFSTGTVLNNNVLAYIPGILQMVLVATPATHMIYELKRIYTYSKRGYGKVTKRKRAEQLQRTRVE